MRLNKQTQYLGVSKDERRLNRGFYLSNILIKEILPYIKHSSSKNISLLKNDNNWRQIDSHERFNFKKLMYTSIEKHILLNTLTLNFNPHTFYRKVCTVFVKKLKK